MAWPSNDVTVYVASFAAECKIFEMAGAGNAVADKGLYPM
jgi:hypothetical protein